MKEKNANRIAAMNDKFIRRPALSLYHPNAKGTGCAVKFLLEPAKVGEDGLLWLRMANQDAIGDLAGNPPTFPTFNWDEYAEVSLGIAELGEMLCVLRGEVEEVSGGRFYIRHNDGTDYVIKFRHVSEPVPGYWLEMCSSKNGDDERHYRFLFNAAEALGFMCAVEGAMTVIAFGKDGAL